MLIITFLFILSIPLWGYYLLKNSKIHPGKIAWVLCIAFICFIFFFIKTSPLILMLLYITSTFLTLKIVVANNHLTKASQLNFTQWSLFCYCWFGMNPAPFKSFPSRPLLDSGFYFKRGFINILLGLAIIMLASFIFNYINNKFDFLLHIFYLIAISLILHFGILNISAGFLRSLGINVSSLFKDPIKSKSLQEFWSKRWNLAFVELTTIAVLRPMKQLHGAKIAFWCSYIFSGLLHELAISLPVRSGFGKPFSYFIIQAILIIGIEKHLIKPNTNNFIKKLWLLCCLFLPIFLLFHKEFILHIVLPLINYLKINF